jgi:hypothetical protein
VDIGPPRSCWWGPHVESAVISSNRNVGIKLAGTSSYQARYPLSEKNTKDLPRAHGEVLRQKNAEKSNFDCVAGVGKFCKHTSQTQIPRCHRTRYCASTSDGGLADGGRAKLWAGLKKWKYKP